MPQGNLSDQEDAETLRCRRVRHELYARFKTPEEMDAWLMSLEKQPGKRRGVGAAKAQARRKARPAARNGRPAHDKPVQKA
ncbi:MAG: hypothetical protein ABSE73_18750 [Planctomycetota bacterium]